MEKTREASKINYNILDIPKELLNAIVELIQKEEDRSCVRLVSRLFFDLIGRSHFSLGLIMPWEMEQLVRVFGRYKIQIGLTFNKSQKLKTEDMKHLSALTQLTSLGINGDIDSSVLIQLTQLVSLKNAMDTIVATSTLQHLSNLTHLRVNLVGDASETVILTNLMSLSLINERNSWPNMTCRKVTSLTLRSRRSPPQEWLAQFKPKTMILEPLSRIQSMNYDLPSVSCQNLKSLSIAPITLDDKSEVPWHQLKELSLNFIMRIMDTSDLKRCLSKCTSLKTLNIRTSSQDMVDAIVVREMKHLQSFTLRIGGTLPIPTSVKNLIPQFNKDSLKTLSLTLRHDHEECFVEISKMTKLKNLSLSILSVATDYGPVNVSSLMTMTFLTSLTLHYGKYIGLDNLTNMTNLNTLTITSYTHVQLLNKLSLTALKNLTDLELTDCVNITDIHGVTQLTRLVYDAPDKTTGAIEYIAEELANLKEISLGPLAIPIPWTDIAKFTALESLSTFTFYSDDSITQLQNLKRLTRLSNKTFVTQSHCAHFNLDHLASLTQLQHIQILVSEKGMTASLSTKLPRLLQLKEILCMKCVKRPKKRTGKRI